MRRAPVINKKCDTKDVEIVNQKMLLNDSLREETFEGRSHLVAPVVMMVEGVHAGSAGPMFYSAEVLAAMAEGWNGTPVPVYHPESDDGPTTCNDPRILEQFNIGRLFNVQFDDGRLRGEVWLDINRSEQVYPGLIADIRNGEQVEVSTGMFTEFDETPGEWNGENYAGSVVNLRPDHLALLPGRRGACSWLDGCGIRNHALISNADDDMKPFLEKRVHLLEADFKLFANEVGQREVWRQLQRQADELDGPDYINGMHFVEEVYSDYFIMRREGPGANGTKLYRMDYTVDEETEKAKFEGQAQEVIERREYVPVNQQEEANMAEKDLKNNAAEDGGEDTPCCAEKIQALIDNESTQWTEDDRAALEELPEDVLDKMTPVANEEEPADVEPPVDEPASVDEYIQNAPEEFRPVLKHAMQTHKARVDGLVEAILANKANSFTEEQLRKKDLDELVALAKLAQVKVQKDYSVAPVANEEPVGGEEPLDLPTVNYGE